MEAACDSRIPTFPFSCTTGESVDSLSQLEELRLRLSEVTTAQIRQRWRSTVGFALARHYRTQLLVLLAKKNTSHTLVTDYDNGSSVGQAHYLLPEGTTTPIASNEFRIDADMRLLHCQLQQQIRLTETVKNAAEQEIDYLKSLLAAESGNYASAVHALEEKHQAAQHLTAELVQTRQALASVMQKHTGFKKTFTLMESRLAELIQRDTTNRLALNRLVDRLAHISSQKQVLLDRLGELESRLAWSTSSTALPTQQQFAFCQMETTVNKDADKSDTISAGLNSRVTELQQRLSGLERQLDRVQKISESFAHRLLESQTYETVTVDRTGPPPNPVPISGIHIPTIDSSETSTPEPSSSIHEVICNGSDIPLDVNSGKAAEYSNDSLTTNSCSETVSPKSNPDRNAEEPQPMQRSALVRRSNRALLTNLGQTRVPRFCRLEMRSEVEPVVSLASPVVYHYPSTVCSHLDSLGVHSIFNVASVQPKVVRHKRYEREVPGIRAPCSTAESDDQSLDGSPELLNGDDAVMKPSESPHPTHSLAPPVEPFVRPALQVVTSTYHPRLSKLGSVLKSIKRSNKVDRPPVAELSDPS